MKKVFSSKKVTGALAAIMAVALLLGGTFAWRDISQNAQNVFRGTEFEAELVDEFTPPENWQNGQEIDKNVYVKNTGKGDIFVRVNFDDIFVGKTTQQSDVAKKDYTLVAPDKAENTSFSNFEWLMGDGKIKDISEWNGCEDSWFFDSTTGWFYWGNILTANTQTQKLLDAVTLINELNEEFTYTINVNMHAFSADQKGIEDLEETDGTLGVNIPDEVKDMVNGIVNNNDKAVQKKADDARKSAEEIQAKIDAGDYDSDASAKTAAEKAVEDYNKAADKYEDALAETDKDIKKDLLEEADNLSATARNSALIAKATINRSNVSMPGFVSNEKNAKDNYANAIKYLNLANAIRNDPAKMADPDQIALIEAYERAAKGIIAYSEISVPNHTKYGDKLPKENRAQQYPLMAENYRNNLYIYMAETQVSSRPEKADILAMAAKSEYYLDKMIEKYDYVAAVDTVESVFYNNMYSTSYRDRKLDGQTIWNYETDFIVDETNLVSYYPLDATASTYGIIMAVDSNNGTMILPDTYNGKNIKSIGLSYTLNANEVVVSDGIEIIGYGAMRINRAYPTNNPFKLTINPTSNLKSLGTRAFAADIFSNEPEFPTTLITIGMESFANVTASKITFNSTPNIVVNAFKDAQIDEIVFPVGTNFPTTDLGTFTGKVTIGADTTTYVNGVAQP